MGTPYIKEALEIRRLIDDGQLPDISVMKTGKECPYFKGETKNTILCSKIEHSTGICLGSPKKGWKEQYISCFCFGNWDECLLAKMQQGDFSQPTEKE